MPYKQLPTDAPTRARNSFFWFTSDAFWKRPVSSYQDSYVKFYEDIYKQRWYRNGILIAFLEESRMSTSSVSIGRLRSDLSSGAEASGSQKNKMTARKGTWSYKPRLTRLTPITLLCSWVLLPIEVWRSLGLTSWSMPYGKGSIEEPAAKDFVSRKARTIEWNEV